MSLSQVGAYSLLLAHQWLTRQNTLPNDVRALKKLARWHDETDGDFQLVLSCFPVVKTNHTRRANPRLYHEYQSALVLRQTAIESGQRGAVKRWKSPLDKPPINGATTWDAYQSAYQNRYRVQPVRNQQVNSQLKQLVQRLGVIEAPQVAAFYLTHNKPLYVSARHPTHLLLRDAEGLRTEWATGIKATTSEARQAEVQDDARAQIARVRAKMEGRT